MKHLIQRVLTREREYAEYVDSRPSTNFQICTYFVSIINQIIVDFRTKHTQSIIYASTHTHAPYILWYLHFIYLG